MIVGLGNPGAKYSLNRHNIGFLALDAYCAGIGNPKWKEDHQAFVARLKIEDQEVLFVKPQTYMNKSGESVRALMDYYKIDLNQVLVLHDEIDIGYGAIKVHKNRGAGGHNGLKSINEMLGTQDYVRLKLGVGRPSNPQMDVASYVLQNFAAEEQASLHDFLNTAGDAVESFIFDGYDKTATKFTRGPLNATSADASENSTRDKG
jgi:PTH1 family peptidyl-tRNA hydrolase